MANQINQRNIHFITQKKNIMKNYTTFEHLLNSVKIMREMQKRFDNAKTTNIREVAAKKELLQICKACERTVDNAIDECERNQSEMAL